jgi:hypothetical protein
MNQWGGLKTIAMYCLQMLSHTVDLWFSFSIFTQSCPRRDAAWPKMDHELPLAHCNILCWTNAKVMEWWSSTGCVLKLDFESPVAVPLCGLVLIFTQGCPMRVRAWPKIDHELPLAHCNILCRTHVEVMEWCSSTGYVSWAIRSDNTNSGSVTMIGRRVNRIEKWKLWAEALLYSKARQSK